MQQFGEDDIVLKAGKWLSENWDVAVNFDNFKYVPPAIALATLAVASFRFWTFRTGLSGIILYIGGIAALGKAMMDQMFWDNIAPIWNKALPVSNFIRENIVNAVLPGGKYDLGKFESLEVTEAKMGEYLLWLIGAGVMLGGTAWNRKKAPAEIIEVSSRVEVDANDLNITVRELERLKRIDRARLNARQSLMIEDHSNTAHAPA